MKRSRPVRFLFGAGTSNIRFSGGAGSSSHSKTLRTKAPRLTGGLVLLGEDRPETPFGLTGLRAAGSGRPRFGIPSPAMRVGHRSSPPSDFCGGQEGLVGHAAPEHVR